MGKPSAPDQAWTAPRRTKHRPAPTIPTAGGKLLSVIGAFRHDRPSLTLSEISRSTDLPLSSVHRITAELCAWGALERGSDGRFNIGLRLWEVGTLAPRAVGLRERAMPFLEDLYEMTHQNVQLAVREGSDIVFVERLSARNAVPVISNVGARFPWSVSAVGLVLLAHAPIDLQEEVLASPISPFTPYTVTDPRRLRALLCGVRRDGVAVSENQVMIGTVSLAAPVTEPVNHDVIAAVSIVVPSGEPLGVKKLVPVVRTAARGISMAIAAP